MLTSQVQPDSQGVKNAKCPVVKAAPGKSTKSPTSSSSGASTDTKEQPSVLTRREAQRDCASAAADTFSGRRLQNRTQFRA